VKARFELQSSSNDETELLKRRPRNYAALEVCNYAEGFENYYETLHLLRHSLSTYSHPSSLSYSEPLRGRFYLVQELLAILRIFALTVIVYISWIGLLVTDTAVIGNVNVFYLESISLVQLWTSSCLVFLQGRILQTFVSHADGAGNQEEIVRWSKFSLLFNSCVAIIVIVAWSFSGEIMFSIFGQIGGEVV